MICIAKLLHMASKPPPPVPSALGIRDALARSAPIEQLRERIADSEARLAAVLDLFSRRIVGWSMQSSMTAQLVTDALLMALWRRGRPRELLHHSDQGSQYTSEDFQRLLEQHGITCSMSRRGDVWDNSAMESFFSTLKTERVHRRRYRTRDEARADVFDYVERFYNPRRRRRPPCFE